MPIENYGLWVSRPVRVSAERAAQDPESPHIHLFYDDGTEGNFDGTRRASINVKSLSKLSELVFWIFRDFKHPIVEKLRQLDMGFHHISSRPGDIALDYIRGNLILDLSSGSILPHDKPKPKDDIIDYVMPELESAISRNARVFLFGEPYSDQQGIHNIHMNQGSQGRFKKYNGVWQDGGIIIYFPEEDRFDAIFLAFASQSVHTDEKTGHGLPGSQNFDQLIRGSLQEGGRDDDSENNEVPRITDDFRVVIIAALVNPVGGENQPNSNGRPEMVYLLNRSSEAISLKGWSLLNSQDEPYTISEEITLAPGAVQTITMEEIPLSNSGGLISLLDARGIKVDGVSYTPEQASQEGEIVVFR